MNIKNKILMKAVILTGLMLGSTAAFAADVFPGVTDSCEQLWLVTDPNNPYKDADTEGGECIDVPVNLKKVEVLFNLDHAVVSPDGVTPVGLKHMVMLGKVMQHRISLGLMDAKDVAIVGIFHGSAMTQAKWPLMNGSPVTGYIEQIFALKKAGINIQLEVCGVTLKGMQLKAKSLGNPNWAMIDERAIYSSVNGKVYVNQCAIGRIIELQQNKFS